MQFRSLKWLSSASGYRLLAVLLILFGASAMLMSWPGASRLPDWPSAAGGLGFLGAGVGLLAGGSGWGALRLIARVIGQAQILGSVWALAHYAGFLESGQWWRPTNVYSASAFMLTGLYLLWVPGRGVILPSLLAVAVTAIGWVTLLGAAAGQNLLVQGLFGQSTMPLGASMGLLLLGLAMLLRGFASQSWQTYYHPGRPDRRIAALATLVLLVVALTVGIGGASLAARAVLSVYDEAMMSRATQDAKEIQDAVALIRLSTSRVLDQWGRHPDAERASVLLARLRGQLGENNITFLQLQQVDGRADAAGEIGALKVPALTLSSGDCAIAWHEFPTLICRKSIVRAGGGEASLVVGAPLKAWVSDAFGNRSFGQSGETLYCARLDGGDRCLATRFHLEPFVPPQRVGGMEIPMMRALRGETGIVSAPDYRGVPVKAFYVSVLPGLGLVQKVDQAELMAPASSLLRGTMLLIFLLTTLGGWSLYRALAPMTWALRQRQRRQRAILQQAPMAMLTASESGLIEQVNHQAARLLNLPERDLRGTRLIDLFDDPELVFLLRDTHLRGGELKTRTHVRRAHGAPTPVDVWLTMDTDQGMRYWILVLNDRREQLVREQELEGWESAFMHARWGIVLGHPDGTTVLDANQAFAQMHGYGRADLIGMPIANLFAPSQRSVLAQHIGKAHTAGSHAFESVHVRRDGSEFPVMVDIVTVYNPDGTVRLRVVNVEDLTAQNEMQTRLKESEHMQRLVLDSQQDLLVRWRPDTTILYANRAYADLFGEHPDGLAGQRWLDLLRRRPEDAGALRQVQAVVAEMAGRPRRMEQVIQVLHPSMGRLWIHWTLLPLYGANGQLEAVQASGHDVTARKAMEDSLRESESWFRAVFNSSFHYAMVLDREGRVRAANGSVLEFAGKRLDQLVGVPVWELDGPSRDGELQDRLRQAVFAAVGGAVTQFEAELEDRTGQRRTLVLSLRPINPDGPSVAHIIVEAHDVTSHRQQERQLQQREARFQALAKSTMGIAMEFRRVEHRIQVSYLNQSPADICPCEQAEVELEGFDFLECLHPDGRADFIERLTRSEQELREFSWVGQLSGSQDTWLSFRAVPRLDDTGVVWTGVGQDVTDVRRKEDEIELSRADLRELTAHHEQVREDERKTMAREIHDELGQNLTALRMGLAVLSERTSPDSALDGEVSRLKRLVDTSISVVRGVAMTLRPAALDLGLAAALRWLASEAELNTRLSVAVDCELGAGECPDDMATAMFRIAQESLTNVARHAGASHVSIHVHRINRHLVMEIADDGCGFDTESRDGGGFGLKGMKERAIAFGGELRLWSQPGEGTQVAVWIPMD